MAHRLGGALHRQIGAGGRRAGGRPDASVAAALWEGVTVGVVTSVANV